MLVLSIPRRHRCLHEPRAHRHAGDVRAARTRRCPRHPDLRVVDTVIDLAPLEQWSVTDAVARASRAVLGAFDPSGSRCGRTTERQHTRPCLTSTYMLPEPAPGELPNRSRRACHHHRHRPLRRPPAPAAPSSREGLPKRASGPIRQRHRRGRRQRVLDAGLRCDREVGPAPLVRSATGSGDGAVGGHQDVRARGEERRVGLHDAESPSWVCRSRRCRQASTPTSRPRGADPGHAAGERRVERLLGTMEAGGGEPLGPIGSGVVSVLTATDASATIAAKSVSYPRRRWLGWLMGEPFLNGTGGRWGAHPPQASRLLREFTLWWFGHGGG